MENIRKQIIEAIKLRRLPETPEEIFTELFSENTTTFPVQESLHWDYNETFPTSWNGDYFGGILRLICAFYNSYGGIIIFGVDDKTRTIGHNRTHVNIENLNAILSSWLNTPIEAIHRKYVLGAAGSPANSVDVLLIPKRPFGIPPARFTKDVGKYRKDVLWARRGHQVLAVEPKDVSFLYDSREDYGLESEGRPRPIIHRSLPPPFATLKQFIGRVHLMDRLWSWLVLDEDQPRLFLYGPGGSGKSTLAYEFARSVAYSSANTKSASGFKIDFVIYLSGKAMEIEPHSGEVRNFSLQDFSTAEDQFRLILNHSGWKNEDETRGMSKATLLNELKGLLSSFFGLIVLDDIDTLTREEDPGMEDLFKTLVRATPAPRCFTRCATSQRCSVIIRFQYRGWRSPMNIHSSWTHV